MYSKTCLKRPLKKKTKIGFSRPINAYGNAGPKYCRILSTFIKLPFVIKTFVLSIFEWPHKTGFTVYCNLKLSLWVHSFSHEWRHIRYGRCTQFLINSVNIIVFFS